jgi:hypothetical protein
VRAGGGGSAPVSETARAARFFRARVASLGRLLAVDDAVAAADVAVLSAELRPLLTPSALIAVDVVAAAVVVVVEFDDAAAESSTFFLRERLERVSVSPLCGSASEAAVSRFTSAALALSFASFAVVLATALVDD